MCWLTTTRGCKSCSEIAPRLPGARACTHNEKESGAARVAALAGIVQKRAFHSAAVALFILWHVQLRPPTRAAYRHAGAHRGTTAAPTRSLLSVAACRPLTSAHATSLGVRCPARGLCCLAWGCCCRLVGLPATAAVTPHGQNLAPPHVGANTARVNQVHDQKLKSRLDKNRRGRCGRPTPSDARTRIEAHARATRPGRPACKRHRFLPTTPPQHAQ